MTTETSTSTSTGATTRFETTLAESAGKTGIVVPEQAIADLGAGKRPAVHVEVNGHAYRSTVAVMGSRYMIAVNAGVREATGLRPGDLMSVTLRVADTPREVHMPDDLAAALAADEHAGPFFAALANSLQRYHVDLVEGAKTAETRKRRIDKALALFREGKKR